MKCLANVDWRLISGRSKKAFSDGAQAISQENNEVGAVTCRCLKASLEDGEPPRRKDGRGRPWRSRRSVLNAVLWVLRTGAPWADLPERYPFLPDLPSPSAVDLAGFGQPMLRLSTE